MSVPESAPVGSVVGRIWAKDRDVGVNAEMKYSIIDGDGRDTFDISTDPTNLFGIITVKKVRRTRTNCVHGPSVCCRLTSSDLHCLTDHNIDSCYNI